MLATTFDLLAQGTSWQTATVINSGSTKTGSSFSNADADVDGDGRITIDDVTELIGMLLSGD